MATRVRVLLCSAICVEVDGVSLRVAVGRGPAAY